MSSTPTTDPPAVKKRGRPKKVVAEDAGEPVPVEVKKAAVAAAAAAVVKKESVKVVREKKEKLEKKAPVKAKAAASPKDAPKTIATSKQATPVTPTTSKILDEVRAKGTLKVDPKTAAASEGVKKAVASTPKPVETKTTPAQPTPAAPTSTSIPSTKATPAVSTSTSIPPVKATPAAQPTPSIPTKPTTPPKPKPTPSPLPRTTTIPLPRSPLTAPSPHTSRTSGTTFASPAPPSSSASPPRLPSNPYPAPPRHRPTINRVIEPTPDIRLPPKYKPAARRVTAIIVGIPIILVVGYELYERWRGEIRRKWDGGGQRV